MHRDMVVSSNNYIWLFFSFSGRVSRWVYFLASLLVGIAQVFPYYRLLLVPEGSEAAATWSAIFLLVLAGSLWPHVALSVKRLHDFNREGFFAIALFIPVLSIITFFVLCLYPGDRQANRFGSVTNSRR
ncbi:DUF805 domain-containing protein [Nitratireductor aestuarii]|uniref:DUF805 domain-containing protein n=2 Tax=Nitratireductor aestuarii TaxID=1735103 RepID=A0A916RXA2_9HYPH|nr:DUF805 domain-containing protein [Nitratireductor aestuarii]